VDQDSLNALIDEDPLVRNTDEQIVQASGFEIEENRIGTSLVLKIFAHLKISTIYGVRKALQTNNDAIIRFAVALVKSEESARTYKFSRGVCLSFVAFYLLAQTEPVNDVVELLWGTPGQAEIEMAQRILDAYRTL